MPCPHNTRRPIRLLRADLCAATNEAKCTIWLPTRIMKSSVRKTRGFQAEAEMQQADYRKAGIRP